MHKTICYHTRLAYDNRVKVSGGTFSGEIDLTTVNRLASTYSVIIKGSGRPVFVDKSGREVSLYISVDPEETTKGKEALKLYYEEKHRKEEADRILYESQEQELENVMAGMTHEEIIRKLSA